MQQTVLITGSNGQLGLTLQKLAKDLLQYKWVFTTKDTLNIADEKSVAYFFEKYQPQYCINCAAYTAVDKAETEHELAYAVNVTAAKLLAQACLHHNCLLIHISTDYVFDGKKKSPYLESDATNPINYYGVTKLQGEGYVQQYNANAIIVRTSWVYSPYGNNFVKTMKHLMSTRPAISVVADQLGSPTYTFSLASFLLQVIAQSQSSKAPAGIYHYSNNCAITWYEFAKVINQLLTSKCTVNPVTTAEYPTAAARSTYSVLSKQKIINTFGATFNFWVEEVDNCLLQLN